MPRELSSTSEFSTIILGRTAECEEFQIAVLMIRVEYKEQKLQSIKSEVPFNVCCLFV